MENIAIIISAAGNGTRLSLDYPKELFEVFKGVKLIDFSLSHINVFITDRIMRDKSDFQISIIVVIREGKESVYQYVFDYYFKNYPKYFGTTIKVLKEYFNPRYYEWAGSVFSAKKFYQDKNIVFLPDSFVRLSQESIYFKNNLTLIDNFLELLNQSKVALSSVNCDGEKLKNFGACYIEDGKVLLFQDKPKYKLSRFNAFWTNYAFTKDIGKELYIYLNNNIMHNMKSYDKMSFYPIHAFTVDTYFDLGTYQSVEEFKDFFKGQIQKEFFQHI